jgi:hypothetical protein
MGIGYLFGGESGALLALLFAAGMNFLAYWNADNLVLMMHVWNLRNSSVVDELLPRRPVCCSWPQCPPRRNNLASAAAARPFAAQTGFLGRFLATSLQ